MSSRPYKTALVWLRRDLRVHDHRPLALATEQADRVYVVFVYDKLILDALPEKRDKRLQFIHSSLDEVDAELAEHGGRLLTAYGDPVELVPKFCAEWDVDAIYFGHDDEPYALARDHQVADVLSNAGVEVRSLKDHVVFERHEVLSQIGEPLKVYTPYSRAWMARLVPPDIENAIPDLAKVSLPNESGLARLGNHELAEIGFQRTSLWLEPGAKAGRARLTWFEAKIAAYNDARNFPDTDATSGLSVHLRFGTVSIRECVRAALAQSDGGKSQWLKELIWREFYHMILANFPQVVTKAFRPEYQAIDWPGTDEEFEKWCAGQTGYPIVDAAMRCLNETGWMHNRLRMVVAMFLTKDLLVDWRRGEAYFAEKLLDFELASNNGGWQWSASTGCDSQPYFRIFNPLIQSRKFLGDGAFIRKWVPELAECTDDAIHWPHDPDGLFQPNYAAPLVDHHAQKEKVMSLFKRES